MTRRHVVMAACLGALVASLGGAGGLAPAWAFAAQAIVAAAVLAAPAPRAWTAAGAAGLAASSWIAVSAAASDDARAASVQAFAWIAAILLGVALAWALRAGSRSTAVLAASVAALAVQGAALAGWVLGRVDAPWQGRPIGTFTDPNHLTALLLVVGAANAPLAGRGARGGAHAALAAAAWASALATGGRIAAVAVLLAGALEAVRRVGDGWRPGRRVVVAAVLAATVVGAAGAWTFAVRRHDPDGFTRPRIWAAAAPAALERPVTGLGPRGFARGWHRYHFPVERGLGRFEKLPTTPHGEWLRIPIDLGLAGAALALVATALLVRRLGARSRELLPLAGAVLPVAAVHDVLDSPALAAWIAAAVAAAAAPGLAAPSGASPAATGASPARSHGLAVTLAIAALLAARWRMAAADGAPPSRAAALDPHSSSAWSAMAGALTEAAGQDRAALVPAALVLEEAARHAPASPEIARERARLAARALREVAPEEPTREHVRESYRLASDLAPFDAFVRVEAASVLLAAGDARSAAAFATEALVLEPAMTRARAVLVIALAAQGDPAAAGERAELAARLAQAPPGGGGSPYERDLLEVEDRLLAEALGQPAADPVTGR